MRKILLLTAIMFLPMMASAQDQTLADIRQELTVLSVEIQGLRRELSTTGGAGVAVQGTSTLDRVNGIESELQRLTSKTEELEFRINRIVTDGTNRIGDLEFRLVELEGGDLSALGQTSTLGGADQTGAPAVTQAPAPAPTDITPPISGSTGQQLAVGEQDDFRRAQEALASGDFRAAADQFATFNATYPGSPLAAEADLKRGEALEGLNDDREAARAYLDSFSGAPNGAVAAQSLYRLGRSLGALGQTQEACVTLTEVTARFPGDPASAEAQAQRAVLGCP